MKKEVLNLAIDDKYIQYRVLSKNFEKLLI